MSSSLSANAKGKQKMVELPPVYAKAIAAATGSTMTALTNSASDAADSDSDSTRFIPPAAPTGQIRTNIWSCFGLLQAFASTLCSERLIPSCCIPIPRDINRAGESVVCLWDGTWRSERVRGFWDAVVKVSRAEGVAGLWKGVGTSLTIAVPASTAYMLTYDYLNHSLPIADAAPLLTPLTAGIASRSIVASLVSPLELVRTRLQSTSIHPGAPHTMKSVLAGIRSMVASDGARSLWRGLGPTLWRDVPFSGIYWAGYESGKGFLKRRGHVGVEAAFASGAASGMIAALITMPFDTLKTRRQAALVSNAERATNPTVSLRLPGLIRHIVQTEGPKALFAGLTPRVAKIAPACGIMIACYEGVGKILSPVDPESDEVV